MPELTRYAQLNRVFQVMQPYMEASALKNGAMISIWARLTPDRIRKLTVLAADSGMVRSPLAKGPKQHIGGPAKGASC